MSTNFPAALDSLVNPAGTDSVATVDHAAQHTNANDAIEALEVRVGITGSADTSSITYRLSADGEGAALAALTTKATPVDADLVALSDSAASGVLKKFSWSNIKTALQSVFATLVGVAGGQVLTGGTAASEKLTLRSTAHATKGKILFGTSAYDEVNNRLGIGTVSPAAPVDVTGNIHCNNQLRLNNNSGSISAQSGNQVLYFNDNLKETRLVSMYSSGAFVSICAGSSIVERARVDATGMGIGCTPSARLHSLSTSEQLRLGYDAATYAACTVNAAGELKIAAPLAWRPPASYTPVVNGDLTVEATSNTSLTFRLKGTDGTVRSASLTLA